jgi:hypothetical protein
MKAWTLGALLLLAACAETSTPKVPLTPADLDPHQAIVIYGLSVTGGRRSSAGYTAGIRGYWIAYDTATGKRVGKDTWKMSTGDGILKADDMEGGATGYRFLKLLPGDYAIDVIRAQRIPSDYMLVAGELVQPITQYMNGAQTQNGDPTLLPDAGVQPFTPHFHVGAGEVVYIGDLNFDLDDPLGLDWSLGRNDAAARALAATAGGDAATRITWRPITHVDGTPIGKPDVVTTTGRLQAAPSAVASKTAGAAITAFGLVGTWSSDCSKSASNGPGRVTFAIPASGAPTIDSEIRVLRTHFIVLSAERVGDNQLHLTASGATQSDQIIEKTGDRYQVTQSQRIGGDVLVKSGILVQSKQPMPMMARCGGS